MSKSRRSGRSRGPGRRRRRRRGLCIPAVAAATAWLAGAPIPAAASAWFCPIDPEPARAATFVTYEPDSAFAPVVDSLRFDGEPMMSAVEVEATPEAVWNVLTDFDDWPHIFPDVHRVEVEQVSDDRALIRQSSAGFGWTIEYTAVSTLHPHSGRIEVRLDPQLPHDIKDMTGVWQLVPIRDGAATRVELRLQVVSGLPIPGFVERSFVQRSVEETVAAVAVEAESRCTRHGPGG